MDPDDLAKLNQLLASLNPNGGLQPTSPHSLAGPPQQEVYWPDSWLSAEPTSEDYANALIAHRATGGGLSDPWAGLGMPKPTPEEYAAVMMAHRNAPIGSADGSAGFGADGGQQSAPNILQGQRRTSSGASVVPVSWHGPAASLSVMDSLREPPAPTRSPSSPPSPQDRDAATYELLKQGATPDADYYPSENDALANQARGRAAPSWDPVPHLSQTVGTHGYQPAGEDENLLARMMFAESNMIPDDLPAVGWSIVNRIGDRGFGGTLDDVRRQRRGFEIVHEGGGPLTGSPQWRLGADPSMLDAPSAKVFRQCQQIAHAILTGGMPDPTGGGQFFFSSNHFDGSPDTAPGGFPEMLKEQTIRPSSYQGHEGGGRRNYFFIKNDKRQAR